METARHLDVEEPSGRKLHALLLEALTSPRPPAHLTLRIGHPTHALTLECDIAAATAFASAAPRLRVVSAASRPGPLGDFIAALGRGRARGIVFHAAGAARAGFRGSIGGWNVRLSVAEVASSRGGTPQTARLA